MVNMDDPSSTLVQLIQTVPVRRAGKDTVSASDLAINLTLGPGRCGSTSLKRSWSFHCWTGA